MFRFLLVLDFIDFSFFFDLLFCFFSFFLIFRFFSCSVHWGQVHGNARHGRSRHPPTKVFEIIKLILRPEVAKKCWPHPMCCWPSWKLNSTTEPSNDVDVPLGAEVRLSLHRPVHVFLNFTLLAAFVKLPSVPHKLKLEAEQG